MGTKMEEIHKEASSPYKQIRLLGRPIYCYREVSSTNRIAQHWAVRGAPEGTIVMGRVQTSGMGRLGRQWSCPPGKGILMSMILRPKLSAKLVPQLTLLGGVVLSETIKKVTGCQAGIKWPNDLVINGKKVCGILAQSSLSKAGPTYVILGIGINVNLTTTQLPPECQETSTSLGAEAGHKISRWLVLKQLISCWEEQYQAFLQGGQPYLKAKWIENNVTLGREVAINRDQGKIKGLAVDISERGGLIVSFSDGSLEEFLAEDLSLGRTHYTRLP